ncbi:MAG: hypothetical protein IPK77_04245 [Cellvibrio sp.]|nr:hypothetical protein [Cellvibrio sp.]
MVPVILNASEFTQTIPVSGAYKRINGTQAPRYQYVIDDSSVAFVAGNWESKTYDSGQRGDKAPWYHDWGVDVIKAAQLLILQAGILGFEQMTPTLWMHEYQPHHPLLAGAVKCVMR